MFTFPHNKLSIPRLDALFHSRHFFSTGNILDKSLQEESKEQSQSKKNLISVLARFNRTNTKCVTTSASETGECVPPPLPRVSA